MTSPGVGLIGCGWVALEKHLPALAATDGLEVVALADPDAAALAAAAELVPGAARYADAAGLVADERVGRVAVLSPPNLHAEHAALAFAAGKPALVEKPLALTVAEADAICDAAEQAGVLGATGLNHRGHALVIRARAAIARGELGRVVAVRTLYADNAVTTALGARPWRARRDSGGGALQEKLIHHIDLWRALTGQEIVAVHSVAGAAEVAEDEAVALVAELDGGALATAVGIDRSATADEVEVLGTAGRIVLDLYRADGWRQAGLDEVAGAPGTRVRRLRDAVAQTPAVVAGLRGGGAFHASYVAQWAAFRDGAPLATLDDGRRAVAAMVAAAEALGVPA